MKKAIDIKSLVIGVLATALFFSVIGAKNKDIANFGTIRARKIDVVDSKGKVKASLFSILGETGLVMLDKNNRFAVTLRAFSEGGGKICVVNRKERPGPWGEGTIAVVNKEMEPQARLTSTVHGGVLEIYNKHGKMVAIVCSDLNDDGLIGLSDRYGKEGWAESGKR